MPYLSKYSKQSFWKHAVLCGVLLLSAACGGGGGGSESTAGIPSSPSGTPSTGTPSTGSGSGSSGGGTSTPPPPTTPPLHVGIVGCSVTNNAADGYHVLGGDVLWPAVTGYGGGTISAWALDLSSMSGYWSAFDAALAANPDTDAVWLQLCTNTSGASQDTFENAQVVVDEIRRRAPGIRIFVSAQNSYSDGVCKLAGAEGPAQMQTIADQLVSTDIAEAGPVLGPLSMSQTVDNCHANAEGEQILGMQLSAFFGPDLTPPPPPPPPPPAEACRALPLNDATPLTAAASGTRVIEDGNLYGLYGIMVDQNDRQTVLGNATLFVLRGADTAEGTEIWIFGATAGDPFSDFAACDDFGWDNIRTMAEDADDIRNIINACMGVPTASALIRHVTPHAHYDHVNSDLFAGLVAAGFDAGKMRAYVHTDEYQRIFSADLCNNVPRVPEYPSSITAIQLGNSSDNTSCGQVLMTFSTQNLGDWSIVASHGHMPGDTSYLNLRGGTGASQYHMTGGIVGDLCYDYDNREPAGYRILPIHGTIDFYW